MLIGLEPERVDQSLSSYSVAAPRGADFAVHDDIGDKLIGEKVVVGSVSHTNVTSRRFEPVAPDAIDKRVLLPWSLPRGGDRTCSSGDSPAPSQ